MLRNTLNSFLSLLRGGTSTFSASERMLLQSVAEALPKHEARVFLEQIEAVSLVQRHNPGRMIVAYYPKRSQIQPLPYNAYEHCIAKAKYTADGGKRWTYVVLHDGIFMSIERNVPLKSTNIATVNEVVLHPCDYKPVARDIDHEEHGQK